MIQAQLQLIIQELFLDRVVFDVLLVHKAMPLWTEVLKIIEPQLVFPFSEIPMLGRVHTFKKGKSRKTILKELEKYQSKFIPNLHAFMTEVRTGRKFITGFFGNITNKKTHINFYDPKSRIITITQFKKD
jgi:hypothetical protein